MGLLSENKNAGSRTVALVGAGARSTTRVMGQFGDVKRMKKEAWVRRADLDHAASLKQPKGR